MITVNNNNSNNKTINFDVNTVRRMILLTADKMGLFVAFTPEHFRKGRRRGSSVDEDDERPASVDEGQLRVKNRRASLLAKSSKSIMLNVASSTDTEPSEITTLKSLFTAKISADELLDEICNQPFTLDDFIHSLLTLQLVETEEKAEELFSQMYHAGFISEIEKSNPATMLVVSDSMNSLTELANSSFSDDEEGGSEATSPTGLSPARKKGKTSALSKVFGDGDGDDDDDDQTDPFDASVSSKKVGIADVPTEDDGDIPERYEGDVSYRANFLDGKSTMSLIPDESYFDLQPPDEEEDDEVRAPMTSRLSLVDSSIIRDGMATFTNLPGSAAKGLMSVITNVAQGVPHMSMKRSSNANNPNHPHHHRHHNNKKQFQAWLETLRTKDLFFNAPNFMMEMKEDNANQEQFLKSQLQQDDSNHNDSANNSNLNDPDGLPIGLDNQTYGVTILVQNTKYHIKCSTFSAFCGFKLGCRLAIEQSFVDFIVKGKKEEPLQIEDFQVNILMKVRPDGSTKVLEIMEGELQEQKVNRTIASSLASLIRGNKRSKHSNKQTQVVSKRKKAMQRAALLMPFLSGSQSLMIRAKPTSSRPDDQNIPAVGGVAGDVVGLLEDAEQQELINVSFHVSSVSLSVIDATPYEILYLRLDEINMKVLRFIDSVQFTVAVQQIEIANQLLSPSFPVVLFPRKDFRDVGKNKKLMNLPGYSELYLGNSEFPTLYLHMHQRYHKNKPISGTGTKDKDNDESKANNNTAEVQPKGRNESRLWYFDIFTLWLAPLQLALEEEFTVRLFRFLNALRVSISDDSNDNRRGRKLKEDDYTMYSQQQSLISDGNNLSGGNGDGNSAGNNGSSTAGGSGAGGGGGTGTGNNAGNNANATALINHPSNRLIGLDHISAFEMFTQFMDSGKRVYQDFKFSNKSSLHLYFTTLQLHPLDFTFYFRPSPGIQITNAELALLSIISQLDSARLSLNALVAQHAYGSTTLMTEILVKHYRTSFWRQFHRLIGGAEPIDNTVGLVANVGGGVYDLSFETMDGLFDISNNVERQNASNNKTDGFSLASRALVGTSAVASKVTGGLGKGVSLLTLDTEFQRVRGYRRYVKATTISEGLIVGTQELGKNIVEGVTGIVVSPYRGWETGGGVGFGYGVAKGILGVALKPAVGVFDLASRATEGLRNTASTQQDKGIVTQLETIHRTRIPRSFGRLGLLLNYDASAAAAQYIADSLTGFLAEPRMHVISHLFHRRNLKSNEIDPNDPSQSAVSMMLHLRPKSMGFLSSNKQILASLTQRQMTIQEEICSLPQYECWGMRIFNYYLTLVCPDRITLVQISNDPSLIYNHKKSLKGSTNTRQNSSSLLKKKSTQNIATKKVYRKMIWTCPANAIEQFGPDPRGDLIITVNTPVALSGQWHVNVPVILDLEMANYYIFQSLLEQTFGIGLARQHPLAPVHKGVLYGNVKKRYTSGFRSFIMSPTTHVYRLFGNVLYEYTKRSTTGKPPKDVTSSPQKQRRSSQENGDSDEPSAASSSSVSNNVSFNPDESNSEEYSEHLISQLFPMDSNGPQGGEMKRRNSSSTASTATVSELSSIDREPNALNFIGKLNSSGISTIREDPDEDNPKDDDEEGDAVPQQEGTTDEPSSRREDGENDEEDDRDLSRSDRLAMINIPAVEVDDVEDNDDDNDSNNSFSSPRHALLPSTSSSSYQQLATSSPLPDRSNSTTGKHQPPPSLHPPRHSISSSHLSELPPISEEQLEKEYFLSFVYPLIDLSLSGPNSEENGKLFSITIAPVYQPKMRVIKREDESEQFIEYHKNNLTMLFPAMEQATAWRTALEDRILYTLKDSAMMADLVPLGPLKIEDKSNLYQRMAKNQLINNNPAAAPKGEGDHAVVYSSAPPVTTAEDGVLNMLVIPTSAWKPEETEAIKVEIFETLSAIKRY
jgi:hypothetical protein